MDEERDVVVFEDDDGNELTMEVLDYLFYEGKEYALLTEYVENSACDVCAANAASGANGGENACAGCANQREAFVMEVRPVEGDDENEEFVPIDEALAEKLIDIFQNSDFDEEDFDDEFPDDEEEE